MESNKAPSGRPSQRQRLLEARITQLEHAHEQLSLTVAALAEHIKRLEEHKQGESDRSHQRFVSFATGWARAAGCE